MKRISIAKRTVGKAVVVFLIGFTVLTYFPQQDFAAGKPVELSADSIEYDSVKGIMVATGDVKIIQEKAVLTGKTAEYNTKTKEALITGGVKAIKDDATLTAFEVRAFDENHLAAVGDVVLVKGESRLTGPKVDYFADKEYAVVPENGIMTTTDGVVTANKIESYFKDNRAVCTGNVHIVSQPRKLDAVSDNAVYYGGTGNAGGKVVLTGNARAVQEGNVLTGNTLTIYLDSKAMDAQGRTKLVVQPASSGQ